MRSFRAGKVHAVIDRNGDHKADRVVLIVSDDTGNRILRISYAR